MGHLNNEIIYLKQICPTHLTNIRDLSYTLTKISGLLGAFKNMAYSGYNAKNTKLIWLNPSLCSYNILFCYGLSPTHPNLKCKNPPRLNKIKIAVPATHVTCIHKRNTLDIPIFILFLSNFNTKWRNICHVNCDLWLEIYLLFIYLTFIFNKKN